MGPVEIDRTAKIVSAIVGHFKALGYEAGYEIVDRSKIETDEGTDAVIIVGAKMFGIQVKRIYKNLNIRYRLKEKQHIQVKKRDWVYYAFPEDIPRTAGKDVLLYRTLFSPGNFDFKEKIELKEITDGVRWETLSGGINKCTIGIHIRNEREKANLNIDLKSLFEEHVVAFAINIEKKYLRVSGYENQIDRRSFVKKRNKFEYLDEKTKDRLRKLYEKLEKSNKLNTKEKPHEYEEFEE